MKMFTKFQKMKDNGERIAMITAYDAPSAQLVEQAGVDLILVGDSVGMVVLGYDSTIPVTVDDIILHTKAVKRGAKSTFIVADMPFLSHHTSLENTFSNARKIMQEAGADALKLEGAGTVIETIAALTSAGIPIVGHLGLTPQSVGVLGGYRVQGKEPESAQQLLEDAKAIEAAGAFALVVECVPKQLGKLLAEQLNIPVIGIGAGAGTDGQVLVYHDLIGYGNGHVPKFVKAYAQISETIETAVADYVKEVKEQQFPEESHSFTMKQEAAVKLYGGNS